MSRTPFQLRMDDARLERLRRVAATMKMSKAEIIEAAIDARLDMLEGYVKLDTAPPKTAKVKGGLPKASLVPGGIVYADGLHDAAVLAGRMKAEAKAKPPSSKQVALARSPRETRSVRGYAIDGSPIYR